MKHRSTMSFSLAASVGMGALAITSPARADFPTAADEVTEIMMEAMGGTWLNITHLLGFGSGGAIALNTEVDAQSRTFSYTIAPGASYLGSPITAATTGWFDQETDVYRWSSIIGYGNTTHHEEGQAMFLSGGPLRGPAPLAEIVELTTINGETGALGEIEWRPREGGGLDSSADFEVPGEGVYPAFDFYASGALYWNCFHPLTNASITITGGSPVGGGTGASTVVFEPTPGTGSLLLIAGGAAMRRRRQRGE